ncbi:sortase domain-bontaining protein [Humibacillus sp. DSM 29435]|uniref:sortase domain-containing protein n=1 Tax=Humibacillus sp. DSM 29435 TaxID=1869167 RepID=UPI0009F200C5|nr:sortase [Humibacillus sp. DSM 29435]
MSHLQQSERGRRGTFGVAAAAALLLVVGLVVLVLGIRGHDGPPQPAAAPTVSASAEAGPSVTPSPDATTPSGGSTTPKATKATKAPAPKSDLGQFLEASAPTSIEIPAIDLRSTTFVPLSVQSNGTISVPGTVDEVGLYRDGPTPGQLGPSVLAAHVDSPSGRKGIFYKLGAVKVGDQVRITRADKSTLTFTVDKVSAYRKTEFPTDLVYKGDYKRAEIRLVTCGGPVDSANEYRDNVVVFGHLTSARTTA